MGTDTLVKEFKGRKDHADYIKRGIKVENEFIQTAKSHGYTVAIASDEENINKHIDLYLTYKGQTISVDVKARRTGNKQRVFDDSWIVVEFLNTMGNKGWLYGDCDYFVFEREHDYVVCEAKELVELTDKVVDKNTRVESYRDAEYKTWGRKHQGKQDLISRIEMSLILNLNKTFIMNKHLDNNVKPCNNSIINKQKRNINMSIIQGTANWAHIIKPNFKFKEEGEWSIDVCNLDEKNLSIVKKDGLNVKNNDAKLKAEGKPLQGNFVTLKAKTIWPNTGEKKDSPKVVGADKLPFTEAKVGNGSFVTAKYTAYEHKPYGIFSDLKAVMVVNFVPAPDTSDGDMLSDFDVVEDGYKSKQDADLDFA